MQLGSKEFYEIIKSFEKCEFYRSLDLSRVEDSEWKKKGHIYNNGETNQLFKAFYSGYAAARCEYLIGS